MFYSAEESQVFGEKIKTELGFAEVVFDKQMADDLYFKARDEKGIEDRIRLKPALGILYTYYQGRWRQVPGFKFE